MRIEAEIIAQRNKLKENEDLTKKRIDEMANRWKMDEGKVEIMKKKAITLQAEVDVLKHRTQELARLIETCPQVNENSQAINRCIVRVLSSLNISCDGYDNEMKELRELLFRRIPEPTAVIQKNDIHDHETLISQNLVLREIVKKLKNELNEFQKKEALISKRLRVKSGEEDTEKELIQSSEKNEKLRNMATGKNNEVENLKTREQEVVEKIKTNFGVISKINCDTNDRITLMNKFVQTDNELPNYFEIRKSPKLNDDESQQKAHWELREERVTKFKEEATRDKIENFELSSIDLDSELSSEENDITLKDKQNVEKYVRLPIQKSNTIKDSQFFEPIESHLNSIRYKEYTIPFSKNDSIKIRHPTVQVSKEKIFRVLSVYSEEEYENTSIDETVLYFNFKYGHVDFLKPRMFNCGIQTLLIKTANVFTQTTASIENLPGLSNKGLKMLNSEKRAIEHSLRDLKKTVSKFREEALEEARTLIGNSEKFPPSEEFFDCIRYLSQCGTT